MSTRQPLHKPKEAAIKASSDDVYVFKPDRELTNSELTDLLMVVFAAGIPAHLHKAMVHIMPWTEPMLYPETELQDHEASTL